MFRVPIYLFLFVGCDSDTKNKDTGQPLVGVDIPPGESGSIEGESYIEGRDCPPGSLFTWENLGEAIMLNYCVGCHSENLEEGSRANAPLGVDFNTHELTQSWLERIYARSADSNTTMPPIDNMTPDERQDLGDWLACGAP